MLLLSLIIIILCASHWLEIQRSSNRWQIYTYYNLRYPHQSLLLCLLFCSIKFSVLLSSFSVNQVRYIPLLFFQLLHNSSTEHLICSLRIIFEIMPDIKSHLSLNSLFPTQCPPLITTRKILLELNCSIYYLASLSNLYYESWIYYNSFVNFWWNIFILIMIIK